MDAINSQYATKLRYVLDVLLLIIFVSSSFDIIFNIKITGFSIRICTLAMLIFSAFVLGFSIFNFKKINIKFLGFWSFLIWLIFLIFFIPNSLLITRGIGYMIWLCIFFAFIIALTQYIRDLHHFQKILIFYINSFTLIGIYGLIQWCLMITGLNDHVLFFFKSGIPRLHGFSYEPSYFSTYLFVPWSFHFLLFFSNLQSFKKKIFNTYALLILTLVLFLSFSRMGILAMILLALSQVMYAAKRVLFYRKIKVRELLFISFFGISVFFIFIFALFNYNKFISLFEGLPYLSRYWHSATIRMADFNNTWMIFMKSPFVGYSLGGVAPAIAHLKGYTHITQEVVKNTEGMCIFLEVLAASGVIGFFFFMLFIIRLLRSSAMLKKLLKININILDIEMAFIHKLLLQALVFQFLLLCMNQNILRNYLWIHIAIVNLSFFAVKDHIRSSRVSNGT